MGRVPEIITILQWTDPLVFLRHLRTESKTSRDFTRVPNPAFKKLPLPLLYMLRALMQNAGMLCLALVIAKEPSPLPAKFLPHINIFPNIHMQNSIH